MSTCPLSSTRGNSISPAKHGHRHSQRSETAAKQRTRTASICFSARRSPRLPRPAVPRLLAFGKQLPELRPAGKQASTLSPSAARAASQTATKLGDRNRGELPGSSAHEWKTRLTAFRKQLPQLLSPRNNDKVDGFLNSPAPQSTQR